MADYNTIARPYAKAVFDVALEAQDLSTWSSALATAAAIVSDASARAFLGRPELKASQRADFMAQICAGLDAATVLSSGNGLNFLRILCENDRLGALAEISAQFDQLKAEQENKVKVTLVAASAVNAAQADRIVRALSARLGREVELELKVDQTLLGGAVIQARDMVIDDSLQTRLKRLASALVD